MPSGRSTVAEGLLWLERELAPFGIVIERAPEPDSVAFTLLVRRGAQRAAFSWQPGDDVLSVSYAAQADAELQHDANISVPRGEGLYAEIWSEAKSLLAG